MVETYPSKPLYSSTGFSFLTSIAVGTDASSSSSRIRIANNKTGEFSVSLTTKISSTFRITSIKLETSADVAATKWSSSQGTIARDESKKYTFTPSTGSKTSVTFSLENTTGKNLDVQKVTIYMTDDGDTYTSETATMPSSLTDGVGTPTSTHSPAIITSVETDGDAGTSDNWSNVNFGNNKKLTINTKYPIKAIYFSWQKNAPTDNAKWADNVSGTYDKSKNLWSAPNTTTKSVTFTRTESNTANLPYIHIEYYSNVPQTPSFESVVGNVYQNDYLEVTSTLAEEIYYAWASTESQPSNPEDWDHVSATDWVGMIQIPGNISGTQYLYAYGKNELSGAGAISHSTYTVAAAKTSTTTSFSTPTTSFDLTSVPANNTITNTASVSNGPGDETISYTSSDETVATVASGGVVSCLKAGQTIITATYDGNSLYAGSSANYTLSVYDTPTLGADDVSVNKGETSTISVTATGVLGNDIEGLTYGFESAATGTATVNSSGVVSGVAEGNTTVTISSAAQGYYKAASNKVVDVEVIAARKAITLAFSATSITDFNYDNETLTAPTLSAVDEDENPVDLEDLPELTFSTPGGGVVTVNATTGALTAANVNIFGSSTITAAFPGNSTYKPATPKTYTVSRAPMLYQVKFGNGFEAFIEEGTKKVKVFYMAGTSAPSQTGDIKAASGYSAAVSGGNVVLTNDEDTKTKTYEIVATAVTPFEGYGKQTFTAVPSYVASVYGFESGDGKKKLKYSKKANLDESKTDWKREALGNSRLYFFVGAASSISFTHTTNNNAVKVRVNGGVAVEKSGTFSIDLNDDQLNMIEIQSNQTSGDGGYSDMTLTNPKQSITIGSAKWATFCSSNNALNFNGSSVNAYIITDHEDDVLTKTEMDGAAGVPKNTPLLLKANAGTYYIPILENGTLSTTGNLLVAGTGESVAASDVKYVLANQSEAGLGFYKITSAVTVPIGKAYLDLTPVGGAPSMIRLEDEENNATDIDAINATEAVVKFIENGQLLIKRDGMVYDALGRIIR